MIPMRLRGSSGIDRYHRPANPAIGIKALCRIRHREDRIRDFFCTIRLSAIVDLHSQLSPLRRQCFSNRDILIIMQRTTILVLIPLAIAVIISAGCAPPFSKTLLDTVEKNLPFSELHKAPESHAGKMLMVGGTIVDTRNLKEGTQIEVLQKSLDGEGRPALTDETGGRFLVVTQTYLDAAVYHCGRSVTIIGEVTGSKVQPLGELGYRYPVLTAKELHLWSPYSGPRFSIGVGMYRGF